VPNNTERFDSEAEESLVRHEVKALHDAAGPLVFDPGIADASANRNAVPASFRWAPIVPTIPVGGAARLPVAAIDGGLALARAPGDADGVASARHLIAGLRIVDAGLAQLPPKGPAPPKDYSGQQPIASHDAPMRL